MLEVRVEQGRNRGQAGSAGKSHGAVFLQTLTSCELFCAHKTPVWMMRGADFPFFWMSALGLGNTHTLPVPLQLPGTLLHMKTLHKSVPWMTVLNSHLTQKFHSQSFMHSVWPLSHGSRSCSVQLCVPPTHPNLNFPHPERFIRN